jgi:membrane protein DedA with SNARE-associated domain
MKEVKIMVMINKIIIACLISYIIGILIGTRIGIQWEKINCIKNRHITAEKMYMEYRAR